MTQALQDWRRFWMGKIQITVSFIFCCRKCYIHFIAMLFFYFQAFWTHRTRVWSGRTELHPFHSPICKHYIPLNIFKNSQRLSPKMGYITLCLLSLYGIATTTTGVLIYVKLGWRKPQRPGACHVLRGPEPFLSVGCVSTCQLLHMSTHLLKWFIEIAHNIWHKDLQKIPSRINPSTGTNWINNLN